MTKLPVDQYLQNSARTGQEMKDSLEGIRDVIAELGGGYTGNAGTSWTIEALTISSDVIGTPSSQFVNVTSEGASGTHDILETIGTTNLTDGRMIWLSNSSSGATYNDSTASGSNDYVQITHTGSPASGGQIKLASGSDWHLAGTRVLVLVLRDTSTTPYWEEVTRFFSGDMVSMRSWLGLGSASQEDVSTSLGAAAQGKLLKVSSSASPTNGQALLIDSNGNITFGASDGGNADTLDSINSTGFVQTANSGAQSMTGSLSIKNTAIIDQSSGSGNAEALFKISNAERAKMVAVGSDSTLAIHGITGASGAEVVGAGIQVDATNETVSVRKDNADPWRSIMPGNTDGLNANFLQGLDANGVAAGVFANGSSGEQNNHYLKVRAYGGGHVWYALGELASFSDPNNAHTYNTQLNTWTSYGLPSSANIYGVPAMYFFGQKLLNGYDSQSIDYSSSAPDSTYRHRNYPIAPPVYRATHTMWSGNPSSSKFHFYITIGADGYTYHHKAGSGKIFPDLTPSAASNSYSSGAAAFLVVLQTNS